jgi:hypothetical protein
MEEPAVTIMYGSEHQDTNSGDSDTAQAVIVTNQEKYSFVPKEMVNDGKAYCCR